jgi:hypothetical protein
MMLRSALSASAAGGFHRPWAARFGRIARLQSQEHVTNRINSTEHAARNVADAPKVSCGRLPPKSWPELRIRNAAVRPRIVSGGWLWPGRRELSCYFKYMARGRIPEFESYDPSQPVQSLWAMSGLQKYGRHFRELAGHLAVSVAQFSGFFTEAGQFCVPVSARQFLISVWFAGDSVRIELRPVRYPGDVRRDRPSSF